MKAYLFRRALQFIPVWLGVILLTFLLFHVNDPLSIAAVQMPQAPQERLQQWVRNHNYHLPIFLNLPADADSLRPDGRKHPEFAGMGLFHSQLGLHLKALLRLDFGIDRSGAPVLASLGQRLSATLSIMGPALAISIVISLLLALLQAYLYATPFDRIVSLASIVMLSIALPLFILATTYLFASTMKLAPVYNHIAAPILTAVLATLGANLRFYRTAFLEQTRAVFLRAARARGISESRLLFVHVLRAAAPPIITQISLMLPFLVAGSLLIEQFFGIAGVGDMMYSALAGQDLPVIQALVYLGGAAGALAALAADIAYAVADPRIRPGQDQQS